LKLIAVWPIAEAKRCLVASTKRATPFLAEADHFGGSPPFLLSANVCFGYLLSGVFVSG
jgi:hypothetical protein